MLDSTVKVDRKHLERVRNALRASGTHQRGGFSTPLVLKKHWQDVKGSTTYKCVCGSPLSEGVAHVCDLESVFSTVQADIEYYRKIVDGTLTEGSEPPEERCFEGRLWLFELSKALIGTIDRTLQAEQEDIVKEGYQAIEHPVESRRTGDVDGLAYMREEYGLSVWLRALLSRVVYLLALNCFQTAGNEKAAELRFLGFLLLWGSLPQGVRCAVSVWGTEENAYGAVRDALNSLGYLKCLEKDFVSGVGYLKRAEKVTKVKEGPETHAERDMTLTPKKCVTDTYYYLAQAFIACNEVRLGAKYSCMTLKQQLSQLMGALEESALERVVKGFWEKLQEWIKSAGALTDYLIMEDQFITAEALFHCALYVAKLATKKKVPGFESAIAKEAMAAAAGEIAHLYVERQKSSVEDLLQTEGCCTHKDVTESDIAQLLFVDLSPSSLERWRSTAVAFPATQEEGVALLGKAERLIAMAGASDPGVDVAWILGKVQLRKEDPEVEALLCKEMDVVNEERCAFVPMNEALYVEESSPNPSSNLCPCCAQSVSAGVLVIPVLHEWGCVGREALRVCGRVNDPIWEAEIKETDRSQNGLVCEADNEGKKGELALPLVTKGSPAFCRIRCRSKQGLRELCRAIRHFSRMALEIYTLETHASCHVELQLWVSAAYRRLTQVEADVQCFIALQLQRGEMLERLVTRLNPERLQITFELGELFQEVVSAKMTGRNPLLAVRHAKEGHQDYDTVPTLSKKDVCEIHKVRIKAIHYFRWYLRLRETHEDTLSDYSCVEEGQENTNVRELCAKEKSNALMRTGKRGKPAQQNDRLAALFSCIQLLTCAGRFVGNGERVRTSMIEELEEALKISRKLCNKNVASGLAAECTPDQKEIVDNMVRIIPMEIARLKMTAIKTGYENDSKEKV